MAVQSTGYSIGEVKDFRKIFIMHDPNGIDRIFLEDVKKLLERVAPLNSKLSAELRQIWRQAVNPWREDMSADFPDFMSVMKECMYRDFAGIRSSSGGGPKRRSSRIMAP